MQAVEDDLMGQLATCGSCGTVFEVKAHEKPFRSHPGISVPAPTVGHVSMRFRTALWIALGISTVVFAASFHHLIKYLLVRYYFMPEQWAGKVAGVEVAIFFSSVFLALVSIGWAVLPVFLIVYVRRIAIAVSTQAKSEATR